MIVLKYVKGSILTKGVAIPYGRYDSLTESYIAQASRYGEIIEYLKSESLDFKDEVYVETSPLNLSSNVELRDYQQEALDFWIEAGFRGIVVLPTGAGKTIVAIKAIETLGEAVLVVVPTLVLLDQWRNRLEKDFGADVGILGGGSRDLRAITVATYDSASLMAESIGNRFGLIVFDEVHHLPAPSYRRIGLMYTAPHRLGLTATLSKDKGAHISLIELVGRIIYEMEVDELAGVHLSNYTVQTVHVPLSPEEQLEYDKSYSQYRDFLRKRGIRIRSASDYQKFVMRTGRDPEARRALLARNRAMDIAQNSSNKLDFLRKILVSNPNAKCLIFTRHNRLVYRISKEMLIPAITHQTPKYERANTLEAFMSGNYMRIVTSQVLDEGVDVPDASLAVILSGTGSSRQFIQRLGRILRKKDGKQAKLVELVSKGTAETRLSRRRKRG